MNLEKLLSELTIEEKAALVSGTDFMYTNPIPRMEIPSLCMSDGPHGLRKQIDGGRQRREPVGARHSLSHSGRDSFELEPGERPQNGGSYRQMISLALPQHIRMK